MTKGAPQAGSRHTGILVLSWALMLAPAATSSHVPERDIRYVLPPDAIPAITQPRFDAGEWLRDDDRVVGFEHEGDARAYPLRILVWHEIADDEIAGLPVAVTYCPLCGTGIVFDRRVDGEPLVFKVSGKLYKSDLVMYDTKTESLWTQVLGEAIQGKLHGTRLAPLGSTLATWGEWRSQHPATLVLSRETGHGRDYDRDPYAGYESDRSIGITGNERGDVRGMHPKEFVLGYEEDEDAVAFRYSRLANTGFAQTTFHGRQLVATMVGGSANLFDAGNRVFIRLEDGSLQDQDGISWDPTTGASTNGERMLRLAGIPAFWFAWYDFHPETIIWGAFGVQKMTPSDGSRRVSPGTPIVIEFTAPVQEEQRLNISELVHIEPTTNVTFDWETPQRLVVRTNGTWAVGAVTVTLEPTLRDTNGTVLDVPFSATFTVGARIVSAPGWLSVLLVALGMAGVSILRRPRLPPK